MKAKFDQYSSPSDAQIKKAFESYRSAFPEWDVQNGVVLSRRLGPLKQIVYIERLRYAAYRPGHCVELQMSIPDGCSLLQQWLDTKYRAVELREHDAKWRLVLNAMEEQFAPAIRKPLDVGETLLLAELQVEKDRIDNINHLTGLAALNAHAGNTKRALQWCDRVEERASHMGRPLGAWEVRKRQFTITLRRAIELGSHQELLSGR